MLNRRHFRVKVMQTIYAMHQHQSDALDKEEKFLLQSIDQAQDLYLLILAIFTELRTKEKNYLALASKKHLATPQERNPSLKFVNNAFFSILDNHVAFQERLEKRKITNWKLNDDCVLFILDEIKSGKAYAAYMESTTSSLNKILILLLKFSHIILLQMRSYMTI